MNRELYERELRERQKKHLKQIGRNKDFKWKPCLHDQCPKCYGTGIRLDESVCVHNIYCNCPKCSATCITTKTVMN